MRAAQTAAADASRAHPDGVDVLIANAGIATLSQDVNTPDIKLCAAIGLHARSLISPPALLRHC